MADDDSPIPKLVNLMLKDAVERRVRKLWFEHAGDDFRLMFEQDDGPKAVMQPPAALEEALLARFRHMAGGLPEPEPGRVECGRLAIRIAEDGRTLWFDVAAFDREQVCRLCVVCHGDREPTRLPELEDFA